MSIVKSSLALRREIVLTKVSRLYTGPEVSGCRPVVVTFEDFKDREEVLRKTSMLRSSNIHITEDMSKYGPPYCFVKLKYMCHFLQEGERESGRVKKIHEGCQKE